MGRPAVRKIAVVGAWVVLAMTLSPIGSRALAQSPPAVRPDFPPEEPVGLTSIVVPTLSRLGCNAGGCHGKAGGQRGFALSLFGADPAVDFRALATRVVPADPPGSRLILKATGQVPHGGGQRLAPDSPEHRDLLRWVGELDPTGPPPAEPALLRLDIDPPRQVIARHRAGQVRVRAVRADGSVVDVTRLSRFESNLPPVAEVDSGGWVTAGALVGEAALLIRYGRQLAAARVIVPTGESGHSSGAEPSSMVDRWVDRRLGVLGLTSGPLAEDAEFARRSALDVTGTLPDPATVELFATDRVADKRVRWIDALLARPEYADHFALKWSSILRNRRTLGEVTRPTTFAFHAWVRAAIAENRPFDRFAAAIIAARGDSATAPNVGWYRLVLDRDERAEDVAQVFLGTRIGCARCHDHPTDRWTRADHAGFAAIFDRVGTKAGADPGSVKVFYRPPRPDEVTAGPAPRPPGGEPLAPADRGDPRDALAAWMVAAGESPFARAVANRYWAHFLGRGLVEPLDDIRATNPPTHPELLDALAEGFRAHGFDPKWLVREIATSDAYARASRPDATPDAAMAAPGTFARFAPRRLPAEALLDAVDRVIEASSRFAGVPPGTRAGELPDDGFASPFLDAFGRPARRTACECERVAEPNLTQALFLLNSAELEAKLASPGGRAARYARSAGDSAADRVQVDELYRVALSRPPSAAELTRAVELLTAHRAAGRLASGYEDLIWAVLNLPEFLFNH